jgi:hypothetical protein
VSNLDVANASAENIQFTPLDHQEWNVLWVRFPIPSASNIRLRRCRRGVCGFARGGCGAFFVLEDGPQLKIDALDGKIPPFSRIHPWENKASRFGKIQISISYYS